AGASRVRRDRPRRSKQGGDTERRDGRFDRPRVRPFVVPRLEPAPRLLAQPPDGPCLGPPARARHRHRHRARQTPPGEARGRPRAPGAPPDGVGRRLPAGPVIELAIVAAGVSLAIGLVVAYILRAAPTVWLQLAGLALVSVCVPIAVVTTSGWVMFHMGADTK